MARTEPAFLIGEFADPGAMIAAAKSLREAGWAVELHTPFPVDGMADALGFADRTVPHAFLIGGIVGAISGFGLQVYTNLAYPLDVGGRPLIAVPAFMMITFELMVLGSVLAGIGAMFVRNRLPRLNHPLFESDRFGLASDKCFFVAIALDGADRDEAGKALAAFEPVSIVEAEGEPR